MDIAVIRLPHIANYDDFDPLRAERGVQVRFVNHPARLGHPHAIILPGTKSTLADLAWLKKMGLAEAIVRYAQHRGAVVGICGGYQMLGEHIADLEGIESAAGTVMEGLGLLPLQTIFNSTKATYQAQARVLNGPGWLQALNGEQLKGYEIHAGRSETRAAWLEIIARNGQKVHVLDGSASSDGRIWGCYLHGLFTNPTLRRAWLAFLRSSSQHQTTPSTGNGDTKRDTLETDLDRLANTVAAQLNIQRITQWLGF